MNALDDFEAEYERWSSTHTEGGVLTAVPPMPRLTREQYDAAFAQWAAEQKPGGPASGIALPQWLVNGWQWPAAVMPEPEPEPEPEIAIEIWTDECGAHIGIDTGAGWKPYATMEVDGPMAQVIKLLVADPNEAP
jgi:hypothetical protein